MKKSRIVFVGLAFLLLLSCDKTPSDKIIGYAKEKYGDNFKEGIIDLSDVFDFKWENMYIISPLMYPEDVTKAIGINYRGGIVPDDHYLILFVNDSAIVKRYQYNRLKIGFSDNDYSGVYKVEQKDAKYKIEFLNKDNYWLYKQGDY